MQFINEITFLYNAWQHGNRIYLYCVFIAPEAVFLVNLGRSSLKLGTRYMGKALRSLFLAGNELTSSPFPAWLKIRPQDTFHKVLPVQSELQQLWAASRWWRTTASPASACSASSCRHLRLLRRSSCTWCWARRAWWRANKHVLSEESGTEKNVQNKLEIRVLAPYFFNKSISACRIKVYL